MLLLTRREGNSVFIGKNYEIKVQFIHCKNGIALLAFDAPQDVPIAREELLVREQLKKRIKKNQNKSFLTTEN